MKKIATILLPIWIIGCTWYYACKYEGILCLGAKKNTTATTTTSNQDDSSKLSIADGNFSTKFSENNIYFLENGDSLFVEGDAGQSLDGLAGYLSKNPRDLTITGQYMDSETYSGPEDSNLGLQRAEALKQYLVNKGVGAEKIKTSFEHKNDLNKADGKVFYPFGLEFLDHLDPNSYDADQMAKVESYLNENKNKYIYFDSGSSVMDITPDIHEYLNNVTYYLTNKKDKNVQCIGHTDNVGSRESNINLGRSRASDVAKYLESVGVNKDQIQISSKGPDEPIGSNDTDEGRQQNRRVELKIQ